LFIFYINCHILLTVSTKKLIIYKFKSLYHILKELSLDLNFKIIFVDNENSLNENVKNLNLYLIISDKKYPNFSNQFVLNSLPINFSQLIEKINIEFLKIQFNNQSELMINNYTINLNSRELLMKDIKLSLTEKEIDTIIYLFRSKKPANVQELLEKVWYYQTGTETHTVETHIYRLRKKIFATYNDNDFIKHDSEGYFI